MENVAAISRTARRLQGDVWAIGMLVEIIDGVFTSQLEPAAIHSRIGFSVLERYVLVAERLRLSGKISSSLGRSCRLCCPSRKARQPLGPRSAPLSLPPSTPWSKQKHPSHGNSIRCKHAPYQNDNKHLTEQVHISAHKHSRLPRHLLTCNTIHMISQ